jgi:hypothetical protein
MALRRLKAEWHAGEGDGNHAHGRSDLGGFGCHDEGDRETILFGIQQQYRTARVLPRPSARPLSSQAPW